MIVTTDFIADHQQDCEYREYLLEQAMNVLLVEAARRVGTIEQESDHWADGAELHHERGAYPCTCITD